MASRACESAFDLYELTRFASGPEAWNDPQLHDQTAADASRWSRADIETAKTPMARVRRIVPPILEKRDTLIQFSNLIVNKISKFEAI
jgi:hypothetical protein